MDIKISGSGVIASGEYDAIKISGSARLEGFVRCNELHCSGSCSGENIECNGNIKISGSGGFCGDLRSKAVAVSGSFSCDGNIAVSESIKCSGSAHCGKNIKCNSMSASGRVSVHGDVEAEILKVSGVINCDGLINAEDIDIRFRRGMRIGSIGGSKIVICRDDSFENKSFRLPLLSFFIGSSGDSVTVGGDIEGDNVALEGVRAKCVSGRVVAIGDGCEIDLVRYTDEIEISPNAKVAKTEKV